MAFNETVLLLTQYLKDNSVITIGPSKLIVRQAEVRNLPKRIYWQQLKP